MIRVQEAMVWGGPWGAALLALCTAMLVLLAARGARLRPGVLSVPRWSLLGMWAVWGSANRGFVPPEWLLVASSALFVLVFGRLAVLLLFEGRESAPGAVAPKIVRDFAQVLMLVLVTLWSLHRLGVDASTLVATSTLLTAVIGLSLQDTLGNLFAGLALQLQRPFVVGDWIAFDEDPKHVGRVVEINWRATSLLTLDHVVVVMPNAQLARAPLSNFTKPDPISRRSVFVVASRNAVPHLVQGAIESALRGAYGVLPEPAPSVVTHRFLPESGVEYWVRFYTDRFEERDRVDGDARDRIWYAFRRAGIEMPMHQAKLSVQEENDVARQLAEQERLSRVTEALKHMRLFGELSASSLASLALHSELRPYAAGELIVREGELGAELFLIERGAAKVTTVRAGQVMELAQLGPGMFFGERSAMTGEPRRASITALVDCDVVAVGSAALRHLLAAEPKVAEHLSEVVASRESELRVDHAQPGILPPKDERKNEVLRRIRQIFS